MKPISLTSTSVDFLTTIYWERQICQTQDMDETIELANDLKSPGNSAPTRKGNMTTKGGLMIHPETTMVTNSNPSKGRMSPKSTTWGQAKGSLMGDPCPSATSSISTTMARAPRGHFKRDCVPKTENNRMRKWECTAVWNQKEVK
ncbi:hypothetical protein Tco_1092275 [Tanacetum coccineum]|uniref:Uncharacterized protein n=1 Tax=Tanacetum coccineum TaxID=301880 RepID=A0ABQ5IBS5_9ASTR